jgi:tetratricopeptide (TPR) repeat protein
MARRDTLASCLVLLLSSGALFACRRAASDACLSATGAAERAIAAGRVVEAARLVDSQAALCASRPAYQGLQADVWVRSGRTEAGRTLALSALTRDERDRHALFAVASADFNLHSPDAIRSAERADAAGYGDDATLLVGLIDFNAGDLERAARSFQRVREHQPRSAAARYNLALVADRQGRYRDAREGYLAALNLDPTLVDARYNLALLALRNQAFGEASHDVSELAHMKPDDPRLPGLRSVLSSAPNAAPKSAASGVPHE